MLADERLWAHNSEQFAPVDKASQEHERTARRVVTPPWSDLALEVARELRPEKQVFCNQLRGTGTSAAAGAPGP